jgi:hypothetical protein
MWQHFEGDDGSMGDREALAIAQGQSDDLPGT